MAKEEGKCVISKRKTILTGTMKTEETVLQVEGTNLKEVNKIFKEHW
jgi:hypothetical protein